MFEKAKSESVAHKRIEAVNAEVASANDKGELFVTRLMSEPEPYRSFAFHCLEGIELENTVPRRNGHPMDVADVRLVAVPGTNATVRHKVWKRSRIAGTDKTIEGWSWIDNGKDATLKHKDARMVVKQCGWPYVQNASNGNRMGTVIEFDWLKWEAARPDASEDIVTMWKSVQAAYMKPTKKDRANEAQEIRP